MEKYNTYSNAQLKRKAESIENEYETIKLDIKKLCDKLDSLEIDYSHVINELNKRKTLN